MCHPPFPSRVRAGSGRSARLLVLLTALLATGCDRAASPPDATPVASVAQAMPETLLNPDLRVEGSAFVLRRADGSVLRGVQMTGAIVHLAVEGGEQGSVKLAHIAPDPEQPDLLRHDFRVQDDSGAWVPACAPNADGETWGFPLALPEGHPGREGPITLTCVSGAVGKCARFGYRPWAQAKDGRSLAPYHAACVQMVRADYCGDGTPHTKDGTMIDLYDDLGIQAPGTTADATFAFEAGWGPDGAVCVARMRWPDLQTREQLARECPRLASEPDTCTQDAARKAGALLYNRSRPEARIGR